MTKVIFAGAFLLTIGSAHLCIAEGVYHPAGTPQTEDIVRALDPNSPRTKSLKGITVIPDQAKAEPSIDLTINFAFNSSEIETDGLLTMKRLGNALNDPRLKGYKFQIAGHTDAKGSSEYNKALSQRRADAVRQHLIFFYNVDPTLLSSNGYGEDQLVNTADPLSYQNRRVQIINVGKE